MQISVIIVNYNVKVFLAHTLDAVKRSMNNINGEIIVVDNASDDGSVEMLKEKFPDVRLIVNKKNIGFGAANNLAMKEARGEYFLLLNPDTVIQEDTVRVMVDFMQQHPTVGIAGCKILNPDGSLQLACRRSFPTPWVAFTKISGLSSLFPRSRLFGKYNLTYLNPEELSEVDAISGSCMVVRRNVYEQVGGFDEQFFMYGEDLDWCYRIKQAGWNVMYVPTTQIIHYKGESTRRSDIDEITFFYDAMRLFVQKHFRKNFFVDVLLHIGIMTREWIAFLAKHATVWASMMIDFMLVDVSFLLGEYFRFGELGRLPPYAHPIVLTVPAFIVIAVMASLGVYSSRKVSPVTTMYGVIISFLIISALTFFFKDYAFSRIIVVLASFICLIILPLWRYVAQMLFRKSAIGSNFFGRRTLIVGRTASGRELLRRLRANPNHGYSVVGFIDQNRQHVGEQEEGVEILGSIDNIEKVVRDHKISEVIFSTDAFSYSDILSAIVKTNSRSVNFRLVPSSLEVIIGKTHVDEITALPLVDIEYNLRRPMNRVVKRCFDIFCSIILLMIRYPLVKAKKQSGAPLTWFDEQLLHLPLVVKGTLSLVGPEMSSVSMNDSSSKKFGKPGLTGLVQLHRKNNLSSEEKETYNIYYAKNQSLWLDLEILFKSFSQ